MATRSMIGMMKGDVCHTVYVHWDGYLEHNGAILQQHYTDPAKVEQLIAQGDLSALGADIGEKHDFNRTMSEADYVDNVYGVSVGRECTFYGRDRGETNIQHKEFTTWADLKNYYEGPFVEYYYIMNNAGEWYYTHYRDINFKPLTEGLAALKRLA